MKMKKIMLSTIASLGAFLLLPAATFAATLTTVSGVVTNGANKPVIGATVSVVCNGNTKTDTTDASGAYAVTFTDAQCPAGKVAQVVASKGDMNGGSSGKVTGHTDINVSVQNVKITAMPELGAVTGGAAALVGGGSFLAIRRRNHST